MGPTPLTVPMEVSLAQVPAELMAGKPVPDDLRPIVQEALHEVRGGRQALVHVVVAPDFSRGG